jgi:hypothetical protein
MICMYVCMYVCKHVLTYMHNDAITYKDSCDNVNARIYTEKSHARTYMHVTYIHTYMHAYIHTYMHTHTHTHTLTHTHITATTGCSASCRNSENKLKKKRRKSAPKIPQIAPKQRHLAAKMPQRILRYIHTRMVCMDVWW